MITSVIPGTLSQNAFEVSRRVKLSVFHGEREEGKDSKQHDKPADRVEPTPLHDRNSGSVGAIAVG
jgi:hypothetical protein